MKLGNQNYPYSIIITFLISNLLMGSSGKQMDKPTDFHCPPSVLSRIKTHIIKPGETLADIANNYGLLPETLIKFNSVLQQNTLPVGAEIYIPPFNGILVSVPEGVSLSEIGKAYGIRPDVLFELNGCEPKPQQVFVPGISWTSAAKQAKDYTGLSAYPLPFASDIGLSYGWHDSSKSETTFFHSGIDLLAPVGSKVLASEDGQVVFVGNDGNYGYLVIINHSGGRQTRYAHLSRINVKIDDKVQAGDLIAQVGTTGNPDIETSHLHFEVRYQTPQGWIAQDPQLHFPE
jgi:murein DD-endopeptidase MepM/ murein hydrolase activator NlpD